MAITASRPSMERSEAPNDDSTGLTGPGRRA